MTNARCCRLVGLLLPLLIHPQAAAATSDGYGQIFPSDNPWNIDITGFPVHANSSAFVASAGTSASLHPDFGTVYNSAPWGIPYDVVPGTQPTVTIDFTVYPGESEPGPYPFPADCPIEGGSAAPASSDRHASVIDKDHHLLYELYNAFLQSDGSWKASNGAIFDLASNAMRPLGWTSADAAGLPVFAGLVRYDEVAAGAIHHALRFTVVNSQNTFIYPARHEASLSSNAAYAPMGLRFRLHANADLSGLSPQAHIIAVALQHYGMMVADNGGNWFLCGAPDPNWNDADINTLKTLHGSDFDAIDTTSMDPTLNTVPPATPQGLTATAGTNQALLSWRASSDVDLLGYRVFTSSSPSGPWSEASSGVVTGTSMTLNGLSGGTTSYVRITAEDVATNQSPPSSVVSVVPSGPATTTGTAGTATSSSGSGSATASATSTGSATTTSGATTVASGTSGGGGGGCGLGASMGVLAVIVLTLRRAALRRGAMPRGGDGSPPVAAP